MHARLAQVDPISANAIHPNDTLRIVRALEETGCIVGYHAEVASEPLGFGVTVFAHVGLHSQAEADLSAFERLIATWPEVRACHMLAGETDFLLKIVAVDWDAYQRFLTTRLTAAPNVSVVKSALAIRTSKNLPGVPIDDEPGAAEHGGVSAD
ncbi:MAG: Lrp/AsnC ligand binding domain-containing protein [Gemmatimonadetes bacterium]|nr:Lrp/AsnC ligand binding domain-containing protein [Gemmatimonadota bacterium]